MQMIFNGGLVCVPVEPRRCSFPGELLFWERGRTDKPCPGDKCVFSKTSEPPTPFSIRKGSDQAQKWTNTHHLTLRKGHNTYRVYWYSFSWSVWINSQIRIFLSQKISSDLWTIGFLFTSDLNFGQRACFGMCSQNSKYDCLQFATDELILSKIVKLFNF